MNAIGNASALGMPQAMTDRESGAEFDPVQQIQQQVSAEKLRLKLREVREAHGELDAREEAKRRAAAEQQAHELQGRVVAEREREAARARAAFEAEARQQTEEDKQRLKAKRREMIQETKRQVVEDWIPHIRLSSELKAQILQAIEAKLAPLPVEELPQAELVQIAEAVRDRLYNEAVAAQNAAAARLQNKQLLWLHGLVYARKELRNVEGLSRSERCDIELRVLAELEKLTGGESHAHVMEWVDDILDDEGLEFDDDD